MYFDGKINLLDKPINIIYRIPLFYSLQYSTWYYIPVIFHIEIKNIPGSYYQFVEPVLNI